LPARVLVVDDDPPDGELISEILHSSGLDASFLTSSSEAAGRLRREKYHALFLDMHMSASDGVELARQVRASHLNASTIPVMITGEQDRTLMGRAFEAGVQLFLFKPVERNKLLKLFRAAEGPIECERRSFSRVPLRCRVSKVTAQRATNFQHFWGIMFQHEIPIRALCHPAMARLLAAILEGFFFPQFDPAEIALGWSSR
jgi:PleD family two-component response regulator